MAMTLDELRKLVDGEGLRYFIDPGRPALLLGMAGLAGGFRCVIMLQVDNTFLQIRTVEWLKCSANHAHVDAVLRVVAGINYSARLMKIGWDPRDGELVAYADAWLMDAKLTQEQFRRIMANYTPMVDVAQMRLRKTIETGADPGEIDMMAVAMAQMADGEMPAEMRKALEEVLKRKGKGGPGGDTVPDSI
jgi:hypothetical protein